MNVTATELKSNLGMYLDRAEHEDIFVSKNNRIVAKLTNPNKDRGDAMKSLFGIFPETVTVEEARDIRMEEKWRR